MPGKVSPAILEGLMCWDRDKMSREAAKGGTQEYTVDELMGQTWIGYEDVMFAVCRTVITPREILYRFASTLARERLSLLEGAFPGEPIFRRAILACESLDEELMVETGREVHVVFKRLLVRPKDQPPLSPDIVTACRIIRACVKASPGDAALGAGVHGVRGSANPVKEKKRQRALLAKIFKGE